MIEATLPGERGHRRVALVLLALVAVANMAVIASAPHFQMASPAAALAAMATALTACSLSKLLRADQQVRAQASAARGEAEQLRAVLESMEEGVLVEDAVMGRITLCNAATAGILHRTREAIVGAALIDLLREPKAADGAPLSAEKLPGALCRGSRRLTRCVLRVSRNDGAERWLRLSAKPLVIRDGQVLATLSTLFDITAEREAARALKHSEARLQAMLTSALDGIATVNERYEIVHFNKAAERMFGFTAEEVIGRTFDFLLPMFEGSSPLDRIRAFERELRSTQTGSLSRIIVGKRRDGTEFFMEANVTTLSAHGEVLFTSMFRDISERVKNAKALRELNDTLDRRVRMRTLELEQANRDLESFSYSISHDLRAPLRAIGGFTALLLAEVGSVTPEAERLARRIRSNVGRMEELIDDVLAYSRASLTDLHEQDVDLDAVSRELVEELRIQYPGTAFHIAPLGTARADAAVVRQILANLIGNACKYSSTRPAPVVTIARGEGTDAGFYRITDNGVGFDMVHAAKLFGMFQRLHTDSEFPGTGVGLAIVKRLVERCGGQVRAESIAGEGAAFSFSLKARESGRP